MQMRVCCIGGRVAVHCDVYKHDILRAYSYVKTMSDKIIDKESLGLEKYHINWNENCTAGEIESWRVLVGEDVGTDAL